jgi:hypothetical protein
MLRMACREEGQKALHVYTHIATMLTICCWPGQTNSCCQTFVPLSWWMARLKLATHAR